MNKKLFSIILVFALITYVYYSMFLVPIEIKKIDMYIQVNDYIGFNVDPSALFFGTTMPGGAPNRNFTAINNLNTPQLVHISASGNMSEWVTISDNYFILMPKKEKTIKITIFPPENTTYENYTGILEVKQRKIIYSI